MDEPLSEDDDGWNADAIGRLLQDGSDSESAPAPLLSVRATRGSHGRPLSFMDRNQVVEPFQQPLAILSRGTAARRQLAVAERQPGDDTILARFGPITGLPVGSAVQKKFLMAMANALEKKIDYSEPLVASMFENMLASASVMAKFHNTNRMKVHRTCIEAGCAAVLGGNWLAGSLLACLDEMLKKKAWRPVLMVRRLRYDETPTRVRLPREVPEKGSLTTSVNSMGTSMVASFDEEKGDDVIEHAKILQTEYQISFLVQDMVSKDYLLQTCKIPTSLQAMDRTTAEVTKACLTATMSRVPDLSRISKHFDFRVQHAATDKFSSNLKTERALKSEDPSWIKHHCFCSIHRLATAITASNSIFKEDTSGVLSVSLACREVGSAGKLRQILREIFKETLVIRPVAAPNSDELDKYRREVYELYLPLSGDQKFQNLKRRFVLNHFMNGNIQVPSPIEHFCPFNHCVDDSEVSQAFSTYVAWALIPTKPPKYSRGRWTNYDRAVMWNGLLASHSLLGPVIMKYTGTPQPGIVEKAKPLQLPPAQGSSDEDDAWAGAIADVLQDTAGTVAKAEEEGAVQEEGDGQGDGQGEGDGQGDEVPLPSMNAMNPDTGFSWVEFNRQQKGKASAWVQTDPCPRLAIMQQVSRHFLAMMHHFLKISGDVWDREQERLAQDGQQRGYRLLDYAQLSTVNQHLGALIASLNNVPIALPMLSQTRRYKHLIFSMTSKGVCAIHQLVRLPHEGFPYKMFMALAEGWQVFADDPVCLYDELTARFSEHFGKPENAPDAMVALEALGICSHTDVAAIECRHASNRDFTMLRGRGWQPNLTTISAKFACGSFKPELAKAVKKVKKKAEKKVRRPGGAWRAFLSHRLRGKPVLSSLGEFPEVSMSES